MKKTKQISESIELGILLTLSGGFMDAYSYIQRGKVFANAQTGNILLFGVNLSQGQFDQAVHYLFPILAFAFGIALCDIVRMKTISKLHWRQVSVFIEALILLIVAFVPLRFNLIANTLTSFACGIQVQSFRKIHGTSIATTMCIGNLRGGTQNICQYILKKERSYLKEGLLYYGVIICFVMGAILGNHYIKVIGQYSILICSLLLFISFLVMFIDREKKMKESEE